MKTILIAMASLFVCVWPPTDFAGTAAISHMAPKIMQPVLRHIAQHWLSSSNGTDWQPSWYTKKNEQMHTFGQYGMLDGQLVAHPAVFENVSDLLGTV